MEEEIFLTFRTITGDNVSVPCNIHETVREVFSRLKLHLSSTGQIVIIKEGKQLIMDYTLQKQNLKSGDILVVVKRKLRIEINHNLNPKTQPLDLKKIEKRQEDYTHESLRVKDLYYHVQELCRINTSEMIGEFQEKEAQIGVLGLETDMKCTCPSLDAIPDAPLPVLWEEKTPPFNSEQADIYLEALSTRVATDSFIRQLPR